MTEIRKGLIPTVAVYAIVFVVYNLLYFIIPFEKTGAAWLSYAFTLAAECVSFGMTYRAFIYKTKNGTELKSKVYGFSMFAVGAGYFAVQAAFGIAIFIIGCYVDIPLWVPAAVSVVILGIALIGFIASDSARSVIEAQEVQNTARTAPMSYFRMDLSATVDKCTDPELKKALAKLSEAFRYSDPVSSPGSKEIEDRISDAIKTLDGLVSTDTGAARAKADEIGLMLADRNRRCKEMKK